jgi:glycosyltransferase involved in cell wall biosynthesis
MGVDLEHFQQLPNLRAKNPRPVLLFLGRLVPIKGVDVLLDALPGLGETWQVVIAGAGPSEGDLRRRAQRLGVSIDWAGEVHGAARDALLGRADVVVIPSKPDGGREEGMPRVALEALAAGAQLVVSDCGGLAEIPESICHRVGSGDAPALRAVLGALGQGAKAAYQPGHWLADRGWDALGPRLLPGLGLAQ